MIFDILTLSIGEPDSVVGFSCPRKPVYYNGDPKQDYFQWLHTPAQGVPCPDSGGVCSWAGH